MHILFHFWIYICYTNKRNKDLRKSLAYFLKIKGLIIRTARCWQLIKIQTDHVIAPLLWLLLVRQAKQVSLQSLPTVAAHRQVQVDRTSRRDCGRMWVMRRQSILSSWAWWLGWRRQLLLGFLDRREVRLTFTNSYVSSQSHCVRALLVFQNDHCHGSKVHYGLLLKSKVHFSFA